MLTKIADSFMLGALQREGYPKQHNLNSKGSYAKFSSITQYKNVCVPDPRLGVGAFLYFVGGKSSQQVRIFIWGCLMPATATETVRKSSNSRQKAKGKKQDIRNYDPPIDYDVIYKNRPNGPANLEDVLRIVEEHFKLLKCYISLAVTDAERWKERYESCFSEIVKLEVRNAEICRLAGIDGTELIKKAEVN